MKKILLSFAAMAMTATAFAAVGDVKDIIDQSFTAVDGENVTLVNPSNNTYMWGDDIQGMIQANGVYLTNGNNAKEQNYTNRDFLTFKSAQGSATKELNNSFYLYNAKGKSQAATTFEIGYFNNKNKFVFGIQASVGDNWARTVSIITADEDGNKSDPVKFGDFETVVKDDAGVQVDLNVKFSGTNAIIEIGENSYVAYTQTTGIQRIKLSVGGGQDYDRGVFIQNFVLKTTEVEAVETANYTLKYVVGDEVIKEVVKNGVVGSDIVLNESEMTPLWNEDNTVKYLYVSNDAEGKTIDAEGSTVVTLTYRAAETWNYTVKNNVNDEVVNGTCIEGESVNVPFSIYAIATDGTVWTKKNSGNPWFGATFTPTENNYVETIEYTATEMTNGLFFIEAEDLPGLTLTTDANADIRCSNQAGGYIAVGEGEEAQPVEIYKLDKGTYKVNTAVRGSAGTTITIKAGDVTVLELTTDGNWTQKESEEITIEELTSLTVEGPTKSRYVDFFLITGNSTSAVEAVEAANADNNWYNLQGVKIAQPTQAGLYIHNGKKIIVK